jgi:hypothetical protein
LGTSVLSVKGRVGNRKGPTLDLRIDTCADITLMSEELYQSLPNPPPIKQGIPIKLLQLTQEESGIKGYVTVPIYTMLEEGVELETEAEVYIVPGMTVLILLGVDYQLTYEVGLTRNMERGSQIHFEDWAYTV